MGPKTWNNAAQRQTSAGDARLSHNVFSIIATPSRAVAFRDESRGEALRRSPELKGAMDALAAAKTKSDADYDIATARLFMAKVEAQLLDRLKAGEIIHQPRAARLPDPPSHDEPIRGR